MLLSANHKDNKIPFDGGLYEVKRGSFITSIRKLCERWGWSNTKVVKFLNLCVNEKMITYFSDKKKTVISIANYDLYQDNNCTETALKLHRNDTETALKHTNNNDNNNLSYLYNKEPSDEMSEGEKKLLFLANQIFK
jgi:DNA replication protein DnaD